MTTNVFPGRRPQRSGLWVAALLSLLALFRVSAQLSQYPFAPGVLDRIQVVIVTSGGTVPGSTTTNVLAPNAALEIKDSTYPLTGQSIKIQFAGQPPVQPILNGTLKFNFPAVTPARASSGVFQPPMPTSVTFEGTWTKADLNYPRGEGVSFSAARIILGAVNAGVCTNSGTGVVKTGAPIPVGVNPVSLAANCDVNALNGFVGSDPLEAEHFVSGLLNIVAGDGGVGTDPIFGQVYSQVTYYGIYKARRRPEIALPPNTLSFTHTDGQPLQPAQTVVLTNTGGLPLNWTATATNITPVGGLTSWLKITPGGGSLDALGKQPIEVSVDPTGLAPGSYTARVTVDGNTWNGPKTFLVTFKFTGTPKLTVTPGSLEFFNRVAFPEQTLTLKNEGSARLVWQAVATSEGNWMEPFFKSAELLPGQTKELRVRAFVFPPNPPLAPGDYSGQITFVPYPGNPPELNFPSPPPVTAVFHVLPPMDELAILEKSAVPSTNETIQLDTEYTNFRADVTYQLGTRSIADLALRLFDEEGNLQASSDFVTVLRAEGKVSSRRLTIPKVKISPDASGKVPAKLILRAVLLDRSLLTTIKTTPDTDHVYGVQPVIKLTLGRGTKLEDFHPVFPAQVPAYSGRLDEDNDWPAAAVVELGKSAVPRLLSISVRLFRNPGLARFYNSFAGRLPPGFEGRYFINLAEKGFLDLPDESRKERADFVQFRAIAVNLDEANLDQGRLVGVTSDPPIDIPVERINLIAADPPFGTTLPRSEPNKIKLTAEYNVPNFGTRKIHQRLGQEDSECVEPEHPVLQEGVLGPGRGQFTYEVTAFFPIISETKRGFSASILMREAESKAYARDCDVSHSFKFSDRVTLPATPDQTVAAADATVKIVSNPIPTAVEVSTLRKGLAAVAAADGVGAGATAAAASPADRRIQLAALEPFEPPGAPDVISLNQVWHFAPAIAEGKGFSADLSLSYSPEVVPDDPNFSAAAMQVISLDPVTGAQRTYATTVDLATRTATARIDSLAAYYTLGVIGPFARRVVNFPLLQGSSNLTARIVASAGSQATSLALTAFDAAGRVIAGEGVSNPVGTNLAAAASFTKSIAATFGILPQVQEGWVQGVADRGAAGLLLLTRTNVADLLAAPTPSPRLLVPGVERDASRTTELRVANPTRFPNPLKLELHDDTGAVVASFDTVLGARATLAGLVSEYFPGMGATFSGYLAARGDTDLVAVGLVRSATSLAAIGGQPVGLASSTRLVGPGFATGGADHRVKLALVNSGPRPASVTLRAIGDTGANLASPLNVTLAAGQQYRAELGQAFGLNAAALTAGSLIVEGSVGGLVGELTLVDVTASDRFRASLPLLGVPATRSTFAYVDNSLGRFTELSVHNPNATPAELTISVFRADGTTTGRASLTLAANARTTRKLAQLVGASAGLATGSFVVESAQPVFASALAGEDSLATLMAIPVHATSATAATPPVLAFTATPSQLSLSWPASATGFVLQSATSLASPITWQPVAGPIVTASDRKTVTVDFSGAVRLFRLADGSTD